MSLHKEVLQEGFGPIIYIEFFGHIGGGSPVALHSDDYLGVLLQNARIGNNVHAALMSQNSLPKNKSACRSDELHNQITLGCFATA
ncbi:hypothetical protein GWI33_023025 [Rhynchophorus ferrugineus]|uniref:Uncharacterized protein n=1 Tax=Rhynchophorus ferrugineus TaxID=354439 RepID=A0A834HNY4_RHYFE|nr:hypothetical protein GWI33_023025 [Rhynchophorus ferrugineus]